VFGSQTAVVVGKSGEEIDVDKDGRVVIQFHWDRKGAKDEKSSIRVRVSSAWAGKGWGFITIPRIGQEVIVDFLEGDPDRPIITGRVYNAEQVVPYPLPASGTQTGVISRSSKGGASDNFNEIWFEDEKGKEEVYIHAEKDKNEVVEHDNDEEIGHDEKIKVGHDQTTKVENDQGVSVGNNQNIAVGKNRARTVGENESVSIEKNRTEDVGENETVSVGKNRTHDVGTDDKLSVGGKRTTTVTKDDTLTVSENRSVTISKNDKLDVSKKLIVSAGDEISFTSGSASITLKKDGTIEIKGKDVTVEGSGKINVKASSDVVLKGSKVTAN
jgi:type VI secretion system secreted protein VgrG